MTFTSCVWGACSGKWNGSAVSQGQIHPLLFLSFIFPPVTIFISPRFTRSFEVESPSQKGCAGQTSRRIKTRNIPYWPRETGNLPAPASGSEIKAVFEMSQKHCCCLTSCTCDHWQRRPSWCRIQESTHCDSVKGPIHSSKSCLQRYNHLTFMHKHF